MGIQTHGPDTLLGQRGIGAPCHLAEGLENPVVLLQEKPGVQRRGLSLFYEDLYCSRVLPSQFRRVFVEEFMQLSLSTLLS